MVVPTTSRPATGKPPSFGKWREGQSETWSKSCKPYPGKRVVMVQANSQYVDMFRNFLFHAARFWDPAVDQLVVAAESNEAVDTFKKLSGLFGVDWDVQFKGSTGENTQESSIYGTGVWGKVVTHRPMQILELLNVGCSVMYSDIDLVWAKPIFPELDSLGEYDAYIANDGVSDERKEYLCTCTLYFHPTAENKILMEKWGKQVEGQQRNQGGFNSVLQQMKKEGRVNFKILPQMAFPNGRLIEKNKNVAVVLHANWIRGTTAKVDMLKKIGCWNPEGNGSAQDARCLNPTGLVNTTANATASGRS